MTVDYETFPLSRKDIRTLAKIMRSILKVETLKFPVLDILEKIYDLYEVTYEIIDDKEFDEKHGTSVMCFLQKQIDGSYSIKIRETVYDNANIGDGSSIDFICHEICHYFLIEIFGYVPIFNCSLAESRRIPKYCTMEWQAKALCGEVMILYDECKDMSTLEIVKKTNSSIDQARFFKKYVANK